MKELVEMHKATISVDSHLNAIVDFNKIKDIYESRLQLEQAAQTNVELAGKLPDT